MSTKCFAIDDLAIRLLVVSRRLAISRRISSYSLGRDILSKNSLDVLDRRSLDREGIAQTIRLVVIGELDAINLYLQLLKR